MSYQTRNAQEEVFTHILPSPVVKTIMVTNLHSPGQDYDLYNTAFSPESSEELKFA
jgi:hypothetical protein